MIENVSMLQTTYFTVIYYAELIMLKNKKKTGFIRTATSELVPIAKKSTSELVPTETSFHDIDQRFFFIYVSLTSHYYSVYLQGYGVSVIHNVICTYHSIIHYYLLWKTDFCTNNYLIVKYFTNNKPFKMHQIFL